MYLGLTEAKRATRSPSPTSNSKHVSTALWDLAHSGVGRPFSFL